jgi:hypothetical protein
MAGCHHVFHRACLANLANCPKCGKTKDSKAPRDLFGLSFAGTSAPRAAQEVAEKTGDDTDDERFVAEIYAMRQERDKAQAERDKTQVAFEEKQAFETRQQDRRKNAKRTLVQVQEQVQQLQEEQKQLMKRDADLNESKESLKVREAFFEYIEEVSRDEKTALAYLKTTVMPKGASDPWRLLTEVARWRDHKLSAVKKLSRDNAQVSRLEAKATVVGEEHERAVAGLRSKLADMGEPQTPPKRGMQGLTRAASSSDLPVAKPAKLQRTNG